MSMARCAAPGQDSPASGDTNSEGAPKSSTAPSGRPRGRSGAGGGPGGGMMAALDVG